MPGVGTRGGAPVLLADPTWAGTLAAARDLGSRGVPVTLASDVVVAPARLSRYVSRVVRYPGTGCPTRLREWLLDFGRRHPGHVLYPTSDEMAFTVSAHCAELGACYRLYAPPLPALAVLLDKLRLGEAARLAELETPRTWAPRDTGELERVAREARFPVFVKPRAQVFARGALKGESVATAEALAPAWRRSAASARHAPEVARAFPGIEYPIVQESLALRERIFTVDGFVDERGGVAGVLGCVKVLQRPRGSGPGICFEAAEVPDAVAEGLERLFCGVGFHGVFDAEFVAGANGLQLIDVNPRFYNHMAFEIERGLPLPWLAYLAALGEAGAFEREARAARAAGAGPRIYAHRLPLDLMLGLQRLSGGMGPEESGRWKQWLASEHGRATDPVRRRDDPWPAAAEVALELVAFARHPRSWLRKLARA